ncbi:PREDICTED: protein FAM78B [Aptenodytes forsteri]|uniref:protein FAM78B n=1 Tax=Aptenodytes forsteri TaxID=9233 RepID=UPI00090553DD|nr:PREDICTED: protein FAM78B [Aptenodytes forsteri]
MGLAGAVVVVLQLADGEGCSPLAQELIKERVAPERPSNEFWPSWSSWELPDLREGRVKAISDSDGVSYPWYGNTTETVTLVGPTNKISRFSVSMNDNFYPSVTWAVPVSNSNVPLLTRIKRDQSFTTWLVAMNTTTKEKIILQTIKWRMRVDIEVDPMQLLGQRARLVGRTQQEQPRILSRMEPIPPNALVKPNANDAQVLMWRPKRGQPIVVIPPK